MPRMHATCVEIEEIAVLIRGPSGSGKSDLALRLIDEGGQLVADDQVDVWCSGTRLYASAPEELAGTIEARGLGLVPLPHHKISPVGLVVDLVPAAEVRRLPEPETIELDRVTVPALALDPFQISATAKIRLALRHVVAHDRTHDPRAA